LLCSFIRLYSTIFNPFSQSTLRLSMRFCPLLTPFSLGRKALLVVALAGPMKAFAQKPAAPAMPPPANRGDQVVEKIVVDENGIEKVVDEKYTYVEQMPQLPGGGGNAAIVHAIQSHVVYPPEALRKRVQGRVLASFTVGPDGLVRDARIVQGIGGGCDEAALAAVGQLPRFVTGIQNGRPVSVSFTVPVTFRIADPTPTTALSPDSIGSVYTRVERMPQLPGGGGMEAIKAAIYKELRYPEYALRQGVEGIVMVNFVVGKSGDVRNVRILRSIGGGCDEELMRAVRKLPRFTPGYHRGQPVDVALTHSISFRIEESGTSKAAMLDTLRRVYPLVDNMPHLPNGGGNPAIFRAVQQAVIMPAEVANDSLARKVFVGFIVGPSGVVRDVKIVRSLSASCDAAALAAVRKLPRFVGGKLNGLPASVSFTVPVLFGRLPAKP
jgi:TonB family protein